MRTKALLTLSAVLALFIFNSCRENIAPTANIGTPANGEVFKEGDTIHISGTAEDLDGTIESTSILINDTLAVESGSDQPEYTWYSSGLPLGNYSIVLKAEDDEGAIVEDDIVIILEARGLAPEVSFSASKTTIRAGEKVSFTSAVLNQPESFAWDFGDGGVSFMENPEHTYTAQGTYSVQLTASNQAGSNSELKTDYITVTALGTSPLAAFSTNLTKVVPGTEIQFTDLSENSPNDWSWDFGDGNTSDQQNPVHMYTEPGTYTISLEVSNEKGSDAETRENLVTVLQTGTATDQEGNSFGTIQVGDQVWMTENLSVLHFNDDEEIPNTTDGTQWSGLDTPAYCWYNNNEAENKDLYGGLYNWAAVETGKLCPAGWHVPSQEEWMTLIDAFGGSGDAGGHFKTSGTEQWESPNTGATNASGFNALPGGLRDPEGSFINQGKYEAWWSSSESDETLAYWLAASYDKDGISVFPGKKEAGFAIRCVKD